MIASSKFVALPQEFYALARGLTNGDYPGFIVGNRRHHEVASFYYHKVDAQEFDSHLNYLETNGYHTLSADEHNQMLCEGTKVDPKAVVLTFDDGLANLYTVAYPLLKQYRLRAIAFIVPALVGERGMISWEQALEMHLSGTIDFQSHSLRHASIYVSGEIGEFFRGGPSSSSLWAVPWDVPLVERQGTDRRLGSADLGAPLFTVASRMADSRRYFPDEGLEAACIETVRRGGGESFFLQKAWRKRLLIAVDAYRRKHPDRGRYETAEAQRESVRNEIVNSKRAIEDKLPGKTVKHFAFPWNQSGQLTRCLLKEHGYDSAYAGLDAGQEGDGPSAQVPVFERVNGDFLPRLPGKGRRALTGVLLAKMRRRLFLDRPYW